MSNLTFHKFMLQRFDAGGFSTDDVLTTMLPLLREVLEAHSTGMVAPLHGIDRIFVQGAKAWFNESDRLEVKTNRAELSRLEAPGSSAFEITNEFKAQTDLSTGDREVVDQSIGEFDEDIDRVVYLPNFDCWEHQIGHHDPVTDIFSLGMMLASLVTSLDFSHDEDLEKFVQHRKHLFQLKPELHPVVARLIVRMTELNRHDRLQDLSTIIRTLENYRYQSADLDFDLDTIAGFETGDYRTKHSVVLNKLKERLFDISRRNRLLNFRDTMQSVNLTQASVPLSFDLKTLRADQLLVWSGKLHKKVCSGKPLLLNRHLNFSEAIYLPAVLDRIVAEARRDAAEFGMAQLRLAICFLSWSNLKEKPVQSFLSPLLLVPASLKKKKGLTDQYAIEIHDAVAEVNPVVRHQFKKLYDIELPEMLDLEKTDVHKFFDFLVSHVENSGAGITLEKIEKPKVDIIHQKAKRRLEQYRRRARLSGRGMRNFMNLDYSYDQANFHPLGVKIFANHIQPSSLQIRELLEKNPPDRKGIAADDAKPDDSVQEVEKTYVQLKSDATESDTKANPYHWQFDLCRVTLANFKYRKMSLVRDYDELLDDPQQSDAFDSIFSLKSPAVDNSKSLKTPIEDRYDVVPCDPTQASAIAKARSGSSYIIQGPPGTGKSQTIANLIADYVARGKRVLFVCEKRAAIDVVYSRLKQRGLGLLCCLIHDSQTDKKEFVMNLKETYEAFLDSADEPESDRSKLLKQMRKSLESLNGFYQAMSSSGSESGIRLRDLLAKCIANRGRMPELDALSREKLPSYRLWHEHANALQELELLITDFQPEGILARHPLSCLNPSVAGHSQPMSFVAERLLQAKEAMETSQSQLSRCGVPADQWPTPGRALQLTALGDQLGKVSDLDLSMLDSDSELAGKYGKRLAEVQSSDSELSSCRELTVNWKEKIPARDLSAAISQAEAFASSWFSRLSPGWWRLRSVMNRSYDFSKHTIRPTWSQVLQELQAEYAAKATCDQQRDAIAAEFNIKDFDNTSSQIGEVQDWIAKQPQWLKRIFNSLVKAGKPKSSKIISQLAEANSTLESLQSGGAELFSNADDQTWKEYANQIERTTQSIDELPDFIACLKRLNSLPDSMKTAIQKLDVDLQQLEALVADESYRTELRENRSLNRFNFAEYESTSRALYDQYHQWLDGNTQEILARQRESFLEHVDLCEKPASELTSEQKQFKKLYQKGRRELEHEFGKSMRYKPIRDLMAEESGSVVNDLKPVWLMSPLSVSDTLPLNGGLVDVVIFDEASQVTLEEAIPTIFRAPQAIVVGDEMQLPPTNFFASGKSDDDSELEFEEEGELVQYDLNTSSLLSHSTKNLPNTMLGWHYRSRSESLISFSNRAFYQGQLLTVPDERVTNSAANAIEVRDLRKSASLAKETINRPVSFHFVEHGIYDKRRNRAEADHIAGLVEGILESNSRGQSNHSIGIVAFSEAQQDEIEKALARRAQEKPDFRAMLEIEYEREEDNQFIGLLVKNLENIQGDERDVIILSVCYGKNLDGRMFMNFGPINKSGGEKRLNVAFSRAKKHMVVVSSIIGIDITNDYNDGARCLKDYLSYAAATSVGDTANMNAILDRLARNDGIRITESELPLTRQIARELEQRDYIVDQQIGQSRFQCDLGVRKTGDQEYRLGILVDNSSYYQISDELERDVMRPRLLEAFGWKIEFVLAKDWYHDSDAVIERLLRRIEE